MVEGKTVTISIKVMPTRREQLRKLAKAERRSVSQIINFMIEEALTRREKGG